MARAGIRGERPVFRGIGGEFVKCEGWELGANKVLDLDPFPRVKGVTTDEDALNTSIRRSLKKRRFLFLK